VAQSVVGFHTFVSEFYERFSVLLLLHDCATQTHTHSTAHPLTLYVYLFNPKWCTLIFNSYFYCFCWGKGQW